MKLSETKDMNYLISKEMKFFNGLDVSILQFLRFSTVINIATLDFDISNNSNMEQPNLLKNQILLPIK